MKTSLLSTILVLSMICSAGADTPVVINELLASNGNNFQDPQGQYDDWIELYNYSSEDVDISGMYLTDDLTEPTKWQIPSVTIISAESYLLIWADNDTTDPGLHANFKLSADGENIALFAGNGSTLIDSITFPEQTTDISYGRYPDAALNWYLLSSPSPGSENIGAFFGEVATPELSHIRGFYDEPFSVTITTETEGAEIYYTLDGTDPCELTPRGEIKSILYTGPIPINTTTCLRVQALKEGWKHSNIETHTYIFPEDVIRQPAHPEGFPTSWGSRSVDYAMDQRVVDNPAYSNEIKDDLKSTPSVCIVIPNSDFFESGGIYANPSQTGDRWEREASIEWIDPNTGDNFSVNAGLRIHGGPYSRSGTSKNALRIIFRSKYGPSKLDFPLFPDTEVESFNSLALRSIWNYSWHGDSGGYTSRADYLRDAFARDTIRDMGNLAPHGRGIQVYINGLYWGLYIMTERVDEHFASDHLGGDTEDYDVLEAPGGTGASTTMNIRAGGQQAMDTWNTLFDIADNDLSTSEWYESIQAYLDIPNMIDYLLMIYYVGSRDAPMLLNNDWAPRNFYALRSREQAGPFMFLPWDTEWSLEDPGINRIHYIGVYNPQYLIDKLLVNSEFRILLADRIHRYFFNGGTLTPERTTQRYLDLVNEIYGAIVGESARWGDFLRSSNPYTRNNEWNAEVNRLVNQYFSSRTDIVLNQLRQAGFYPSVSAPVFYVNGYYQYGGYIDSTDVISMVSPGGTLWYTLDGTDPRQWIITPGESLETTLVAEDADKKVLVPTGNISNNWKGGDTFNDSSWLNCTGSPGGVGFERSSGYQSYMSLDVENQMYGINSSCYIRIPFDYEGDVENLDFMNLNVKYDDGFIAYINGVEVAKRNFSGTPTWNSNANSSHDDSLAVVFENIDISPYLNLLQEGSNILAIHGLNQTPTSSDFLISVELLAGESPEDSNTTTGAWQYINPITLNRSTHIKARVLNGDTWSALNEATYAIGPIAENLRITELMYHPFSIPGANDPNEEFIELTNIGTETINLNLVSFTKGIDFTFPDFELAPGEYIVLVEDINAFESLYGTEVNIAGQFSGRFANNGERIRLEDAFGQTILDFKYSDDWYDTTDGQGDSLTIIDPTDPNTQNWNNKEAWAPSLRVNGSPGTDE